MMLAGMTTAAMPIFRTIALVSLFVGYIWLSHLALLTADPHNLWRQAAMLAVLAPIIGIGAWAVAALARKFALPALTRHALAAMTVLALSAASVALWPHMLRRLDWIYLAQHIASNLFLGWFFARTLFPPRVPLITTLAQTLHGPLPDKIMRYTRSATMAWSLFFAAQVLISLLIFHFLSIETWSLFANVLNWPMVAAMFIGEFLCRKIANPDFHPASMRESIAAYLDEKNKA